MGTRTRLFASAAFPLLSLSLVLQPAHASMMQGISVDAGARPSQRGVEVAQAAEEPAEGEQDPRKRKKPQGEEEGQPPKKGEGQQREKPAEGQRQQPDTGQAEAPKPPRATAEQPAPGAGEAEAPKPPRHNKNQQPEGEGNQPAAEPAAPKPQAAEPEAPAKPKPGAEPVDPESQPQGGKHHKPNGQAQPETQAVPDAEQPVAPAEPETTKPPKHNKKPANNEEAPAQPQAEPVAPATNGEAPAKPPKPAASGEEAPAKPAAPKAEAPAQPAPAAPDAVAPEAPKAPGEKPPKPGANGHKPASAAEQPAPVAPSTEAAPPAAGEKTPPAADGKPIPGAPAEKTAPGEKPAPAAPGTPPPAPPASGDNAQPAPAAPAQSGQAAPQAEPSTAGEQVSPAELERRKKIAENPAAAGAGAGPVILPVQNGTAVLDSDKDSARHGRRGQPGDGQPAPGGQTPGQPTTGQAAEGQRPPAPENVRAPTSDADSQRMPDGNRPPPVKIEAATSEQGRRMDQRPDFAAPDGARIEDRQNSRVIINFGDDVYVRHDDTQRFTRDGERPTYEQLPRDRYRETIGRPDGTRIITIRNRYGDIIQRSRVDQGGREYVLFYSPELENRPDQDDYYRDPGDQLPPMRLRIPLNQYIIDTSEDQDQDYYDFLRKPPVEPVERVYSLNEVRYSARIRDKVRRIDLDTITFATGSADIPMAQAKTLRGIADAIGQIIKKNPAETFLIEGHTDAVGSDQSNLILSDQRAESVANVLTDVYGIPPENLATQGYGEQYLKINTQGPEQENRRVTIRRVTALVRPVASK